MCPSRVTLAILACCAVAQAARGQDVDRAIQAYNEDRHLDAAVEFHAVLRHSADQDARIKAEYYVARSLLKAGFPLAAAHYFALVFGARSAHPYFLKSTDELLAIAATLHEDVRIPELINRGYTPQFSRLKPDSLHSINAMIGAISQRRGEAGEAIVFLQAVTEKFSGYAGAQYRLGVLQPEKAIEHFSAASAPYGLGATHFAKKEYARSIAEFTKLETEQARVAAGWARLLLGDWERAFAAARAEQEPARVDAAWLEVIALARGCELDRARKARDRFVESYAAVEKRLAREVSDGEAVELVARERIAGSRRLKHHLAIADQADRELRKLTFAPAKFREELAEALREARELHARFAAKIARVKIARAKLAITDTLSILRGLDFGVAANLCAARPAPERGLVIKPVGVASTQSVVLFGPVRADFQLELHESIDDL